MKTIIIFALILFNFNPALAASQERATIESYNGETVHENAEVYFPKSMVEFAAIVQKSYQRGLAIRLVGRSHSTSGLILGNGIYVNTKYLNKIYGLVQRGKKTFIRVQPGVTLGQMDEFLSKNGLSLGLGFPVFRDLTIAGVTSTGSHGSSWTEKSMAANAVEAMDVLDPQSGRWILLEKSSNLGNFETDQEDLRVVKNLGTEQIQRILLILSYLPPKINLSSQAETQERLRVEALRRLLFRASTVDVGSSLPKGDMLIEVTPQFNIQVTTQSVSLEKILIDSEKRVQWNPNRKTEGFDDSLVLKIYFHAKQAVIEAGNRTQDAAMPGAQNVNFGLGTESEDVLNKTRDFLARAHTDMAFGVQAEPLRVSGTVANPLFVVQGSEGKEVRSQDVVGPSQAMTRARGDRLGWKFRPSDYSVSFPESKAYQILKDIEAFALRTGYSFPFTGISCRFVTSDLHSSMISHIGKPGDKAGERYVAMEFLEYRPLEHKGPAPESARSKLLVELIDLLKFHDVAFHLGKNSDWIMTPDYVRKSYGRVGEAFAIVTNLVDPKSLFGNPLLRSIFKSDRVKSCRSTLSR